MSTMISLSRSLSRFVVRLGGIPASTRPFASSSSTVLVPKELVPAADDDRVVIEDDGAGNPIQDTILLARVGGALYAIDATCPHMEKSMQKGKLLTGAGGDDPEIRCPIHNSRFNMKTGACTKWVTGALGFENDLIGGLAKRVGGARRDLRAYSVTENDDGSLTLE